MRYSAEPKYRKFVKGHGFLLFARKCGDKYGKKSIDTATKTGIDAAKTASSISAATDCVSISVFASLLCSPEGILNSAVVKKVGSIIAVIKKYKSIIKKTRKRYDKIVLLVKAKLYTAEVLISTALIGSCISHDEYVSINFVSREYHEMNKEIKIPQCCRIYFIKTMKPHCVGFKKSPANKN